MEPSWIERGLEVFPRHSDELKAEIPLPPVHLTALQEAWNVPSDDPMVDIYPVEEQQVGMLEKLTGIPLDLSSYEYFLCCYCTDLDACRTAGGYMGKVPPPRELRAFEGARRVKPKNFNE